jgi:hypothetical protein
LCNTYESSHEIHWPEKMAALPKIYLGRWVSYELYPHPSLCSIITFLQSSQLSWMMQMKLRQLLELRVTVAELLVWILFHIVFLQLSYGLFSNIERPSLFVRVQVQHKNRGKSDRKNRCTSLSYKSCLLSFISIT